MPKLAQVNTCGCSKQEHVELGEIPPEVCCDVDPWRELCDSAHRIRPTWKYIFLLAETSTEMRTLKSCTWKAGLKEAWISYLCKYTAVTVTA